MTKLLFYERMDSPDSERLENELGTTRKETVKSEERVNWIQVQRGLKSCIAEWSGGWSGSVCILKSAEMPESLGNHGTVPW